MKKPERVEVGQWWGSSNDAACFRVEGIANKLGEDWALHGDDKFATPCSQLLTLSTCEYLGSGEHPEPSEWMIEVLAEHAYDIGRARLPPTWAEYPEDKRPNWRYCARRTLTGESDILNEQLTDAMLSLYRILRSLGKW